MNINIAVSSEKIVLNNNAHGDTIHINGFYK
jgi:hypothetical protein